MLNECMSGVLIESRSKFLQMQPNLIERDFMISAAVALICVLSEESFLLFMAVCCLGVL